MNELVALALTGQAFVDELRRTWDAGDAVLPVDVRLPHAAQARVVDRQGASAIVDGTGRSALTNGRPVEPGDALVMTTSGTTGEPKAAVHTHDSIRASAVRTSERLAVTRDDIWLACLPVAHIGGFSVISRALLAETDLIAHDSFDVGAVESSGATLVSLVSRALQQIDPSVFRMILLGGAAPPADRPANVIATYGSTETGSGIVYEREPLRDVELRVSDGQLFVKSPTLFRCYRDGTTPVVDGWFPTGDAASLDGGILQVFGRIGDVINTGGEKVWPVTVESALRTHRAVKDALVFGVADNQWGQRVVARIELHTGSEQPTLEELRTHVKQTLPAYAAPKTVEVVEQLPRTQSGKVKRA
jgi:O-succinylbenzoic acid--CoA ligase